ncbi:DeoR family transcriptional regulator [Spirochaetia bacterium]|nr:DeoR family transcriptional regulator [Spirochaetia bacterium]
MTEKQNDRQKRILDTIAASERIEVAKLAEMLGVSKVTLRKDLEVLKQKGIIRHEKGYVSPGSSDDINNRLSYHYETKRKIARAAAELVKDGETVMIESGSCCAILAEELASNKRDVRIITNSAFIAAYIRRLQVKIVLLGGDYQSESQVMVGPITRICVEGFSVDKFFIGTDGFSAEHGFTGNDHLRSETVRDMTKQSARVIILTESEKFSKRGLVPLLPFNRISLVITDEAIPAEREQFLEEQNILLLKVAL